MSDYEVGSVLWVIHEDRPGLVAYQVIEEVTKKDLEGESVYYIVKPATKNGKPIQLNSIRGKIFHSSEDAQVVLVENATRAINAIIEKTQNLVDQYFRKPEIVQEPIVSPLPKKSPRKKPQKKSKKEDLPEGYTWVTMDDGTKIKMKIPEELI